jgi:hypothetical protein
MVEYVKQFPLTIAPVGIAWWQECSGVKSVAVTLNWDPTKTTVKSGRLVMIMVSNHGEVWFDAGFNKVLLPEIIWLEGEHEVQKTWINDVTPINGTNLIEVWACKNVIWYPEDVGVTIQQAYLEVTFEGEPPTGLWWEVIWNWFAVNWPYVAIAGVVVVGGVAIYKRVRR